MKLEFHQLDRRYEHLRARSPERQRRLLVSLAASGQQTPIIVVAVSDRYLVIDGYKRVAALEQLSRDTVEAVVWDMNEADALVLDRSMRFSEQETALEQGWLLQELEQRFGYSREYLARRCDRSGSWVSRRLALVEQLPETVQQRVRAGEISAHVAMKYLAPVARTNLKDCQRMAEVFSKHRFSSRQAGELYAAWRDAVASIRQRILDSPELFLKAPSTGLAATSSSSRGTVAGSDDGRRHHQPCQPAFGARRTADGPERVGGGPSQDRMRRAGSDASGRTHRKGACPC